MSITAMKQAVAALETIGTMHGEWNNGMHAANVALKVLPALRTAIQEAESVEPVAWLHDCAALLQNLADDMESASKLLQHSNQKITSDSYRSKVEKLKSVR